MTIPSHNDIKAMGDIMAALNRVAQEAPAEDEAFPVAPPYSESAVIAEAMTVAPLPTSDSAMANILRRFNAVTETLTETAETRPALREALVTQPTKTGVIIGEWQIEKTDRSYSVVNTTTDHPIAHGLGLYEAALALSKALNAGKSITSTTVKEISAARRRV
jgi:hypothetical protein